MNIGAPGLLVGTIVISTACTIAQVRATDAQVREFHLAVGKGELDKVKELLGSYPQFANRRSRYGLTPLPVAALRGRTTIAKLLLDRGAAIDAKSNNETPLFRVCLVGHAQPAALFLKRGADASVTDDRGRTPPVVAIERFHSDTSVVMT